MTSSFGKKTDDKQTAVGETQHCDDLITVFRTSSTVTVQLPPQITGYVNKLNISCTRKPTEESPAEQAGSLDPVSSV